MKIVNGLNDCSRVICAARGFVPKEGTTQSNDQLQESKLSVKLDGSKSVDVPYGMNTTWRQLKINLQVGFAELAKRRCLHT